MRKMNLALALVLGLALVPLAASAQEPDQRGMGMRGMGMRGAMMMANPADIVLRFQAELNLTPDQLKKLGKIRDDFNHDNAEDLAKAHKEMDEARAKYGEPPYSPEVREKLRDAHADAQKRYGKLFENGRKAREEAMEVLSADQRTRLEELMRDRRGMGERPGMERRP